MVARLGADRPIGRTVGNLVPPWGLLPESPILTRASRGSLEGGRFVPMTAMRPALVVVLIAGCTKAAPPPQPPADDVSQPEASDEPADSDEPAQIDSNVRIEGPLTEAQVEAVVQEHFTQIQGCFDAALVRMASNDLTGAIAIRIEIDGSGAVTDVALDASNFGDEQTPPCIMGKVEGWSFPSSGKGKKPSTVIYPFFLRSY